MFMLRKSQVEEYTSFSLLKSTHIIVTTTLMTIWFHWRLNNHIFNININNILLNYIINYNIINTYNNFWIQFEFDEFNYYYYYYIMYILIGT